MAVDERVPVDHSICLELDPDIAAKTPRETGSAVRIFRCPRPDERDVGRDGSIFLASWRLIVLLGL
jgi:hypothetical protein